MRWQGRCGSDTTEDRRGAGRAAGRIDVGGLVIVLFVGLFLGVDLTPVLQETGVGMEEAAPTRISAADERAAAFVSVTLAATEEIWGEVFREELGAVHEPPVLVPFKGVTASPCGGASGATGPFSCPLDRKAYLDTDFFTTPEQRMGAAGDFAAAYVVAHEVAHRVQNAPGILSQANEVWRQVGEDESNAISVRVALQADCLAGVWARRAGERFGSLEDGDLAEALDAAECIGDDTRQRQAGQPVRPHTFTHGTSEQRQRWFATGYQAGSIAACDTFATDAV